MEKVEINLSVSEETVLSKIYIIRGQKVMLDSDLAQLYKVETKILNQAILRNSDRFPTDFMFQLTENEWEILRSQFVTSSWGGRRYLPFVFTEHGVLMLSSVLNSKFAIQVNIKIMRVFSKIRKQLHDNTELSLAVEKLERKTENHSKNIELLFNYFDELGDKKSSTKKPRKSIGYKIPKKRK